MPEYQINPFLYKKIFAVPTDFIDRYLTTVCGFYLKVMIYLLRQPDECLPNEEEIREALSLSRDDVHEAMEFWKNEGVLINDPTASWNNSTSAIQKKREPLPRPNYEQAPAAAVQRSPDREVKIVSDRPATLTSAEIAKRIEGDCKVRYVFEEAERLFARPLTTTEQRSIISMHEWMNLPTDVILMVFEYCRSIDKISIRYIEKVAADWSDLGINTHELAEEHIGRLSRFNEAQKAVRDCCGIHTRNLSSNEKKYIEIWFDEYRFGIEMVKLAFERTVDNIGKISFAYMNKILKQWYENGVSTPDAAVNEVSAGGTKGKKTSYNLAALDRIGLEIPDLD